MVRLEKLTLQGFKSFKRKASIVFPQGFSVITGPNGAGKTNVVDAVSFVLGRSSAKRLRARKAHELIFQGSKAKPASDHAKVNLHFDNSDRALPFDEDTVSVSRRINRAGVSTYRLNGKVVTRQQLVNAFVQARIRFDGHSMIQQGDINQIVEMVPTERRLIIDEVSGIAEYDEKKERAAKEMEKVGEKLREAEIILGERSEIFVKVKEERDAALKHQQLNEELELVRASMLWKDHSRAEGNLKELNSKIAEKEKLADALEKEIKELEKKLGEEEDRLEGLSRDMVKASNQIEVTRKLAELRADMDRKKDRIGHNREQMERINEMMEKLSEVGGGVSPAVKSVLTLDGVHGTLSSLISVPAKYRVAVDVAGGSRLRDVVVDTADTAVKCVKYLKERRIGRARFLPMDRIRPAAQRRLPDEALGWLSGLIKHDARYSGVVSYAFGSTACVSDIDRAKSIMKSNGSVRMVTLDGDLVERSGAVTGGFYRKRAAAPSVSKYAEEKKKLQQEIELLERELVKLNAEIEKLADKERKTQAFGKEMKRVKADESLRKLREKRTEAYEKRVKIQGDLNAFRIQKARIEAKSDDLKLQWDKHRKDWSKAKLLDQSVSALKSRERDILLEIEEIGPVNMKAIQEFEGLRKEFEDFRSRVDKIVKEKEKIEETINKIEDRRRESFMLAMNEISKHFREVYLELTSGEAKLELEKPNDISSGLIIEASPSGKKLLSIDSLSGGEKSLTALAFLFAIQKHKPSPFYVFDEADATLDKVNTKRLVNLLKKQSEVAQFILISHNDDLVREADQIYGVSMEGGESKIIAVKLPRENN